MRAAIGAASRGPLRWVAPRRTIAKRRAREATILTPPAQTAAASALARTVDAAAGGRVLVFGSLPPEGRDLDILARPAQRKAIAAALTREGLLTKDGARWVAFGDCTAVGVDLVH